MKNVYFLLIAFCMMIAFLSCQKEDILIDESESILGLPSSFSTGGNVVSSFIYDNNNRFSEIDFNPNIKALFVYSGSDISAITFSQENSGKGVQGVFGLKKIGFIYQNANKIIVEYHFTNDATIYTDTIILNNKKLPEIINSSSNATAKQYTSTLLSYDNFDNPN